MVAPEPATTVNTPLLTVKVVSMELPSSLASSLTLKTLPLAALKVNEVSSVMICAAGTVLTGASFTASTVITTDWLSAPKPLSLPTREAVTSKPNVTPAMEEFRSAEGVKSGRALPSAVVINVPSAIGVTPSP